MCTCTRLLGKQLVVSECFAWLIPWWPSQKLVSDRRAWFTEEIGKGVFPESMQAYYDFLKGPDPAAEAEAKDDGKGKKGKKDKKDKKEKKGKKV
jgi:hypothetical protein